MKRRDNSKPGLDARKVLADNLKRLMEKTPEYGSTRLLGRAAKVADGSIGYMLDPEEGNPTINNIAKVAGVFGLQPWQLLHKDLPARAMTERELGMYSAIEKAFSELSLIDPIPGNKKR